LLDLALVGKQLIYFISLSALPQAPEVMKGHRYSEKADVYSFGIILWEVITRKQPFGGNNFMNVALEVLEGHRPTIPSNCPEPLVKLMKKCWHANPAKRPPMDHVVQKLDKACPQEDSGLKSDV